MPLEAHQQSRVGERSGAVHYPSRWSKSVRHWQKVSPFNPYWLDRRCLRKSVEALAPKASGVLLDVGSSETPYRDIFEEHVRHYVGMEYPPAVLDKQPDMWDLLYNVHHLLNLLGDGRRMPIRTDSVDTVLCTEVLEHVPDPMPMVHEMARVLKPGGKLLVTVPFVQPLHELPSDFHRFTPPALQHYAEEAGLVVESIEPRGNFASACGAMLSQWIIRTIGTKTHQTDGSVVLSRWRSVPLLPFTAIIQAAFLLASKLTHDDTVCHGYTLIAVKPGNPG
ncbi:MAG: methyltransferase domain-containing protein [Planctomycetota bacterium]|nr:methyltransferase domain-containing protein [Planctomycetota bacterium]